MLDSRLPLVIRKTRSPFDYRDIPPHKWWIDKNTPVGEDADIYELMPHGGKRYLNRKLIVGNRNQNGSISGKD